MKQAAAGAAVSGAHKTASAANNKASPRFAALFETLVQLMMYTMHAQLFADVLANSVSRLL